MQLQSVPMGKIRHSQFVFGNKILANALEAFDPLRIRVGGSLQDQVMYKVGISVKKCPHFKRRDDGLFGFSKGCLPMERWDLLNKLFYQTGPKMTFGLNALIGRNKSKDDESLMVCNWSSRNVDDFINYTVSEGYKIDSYELVQKVYPDPTTQPKVLGPAGFYDERWFNTFLQTSGPDVVDGLTHHIYNLGPGDDPSLMNKIQDPSYLDQIAQTYKDVSTSIKLHGPEHGSRNLVVHIIVVAKKYHILFLTDFGTWVNWE
ncbi:hypothetical protein RD792_011341 [Penstemon davidsonii]|uniref:Heparanase-like protein 2 n=1 Tax=Penstemon davidsonii TaxID=160366 RepID=A0ABR0D5Q2_9LAMI|nr:hypothetical protein RD792_011341 [Penstemon davidsonii]